MTGPGPGPGRIRIEVTEHGIKPQAGLRAGIRAYVDADWVSAATRSAVALLVPTNGTSAQEDADRTAGLALLGVAQRLVDELTGVPAERIEITGTGFIAGAVRRLVGVNGQLSGARPSAVVETTGDPERVLAATRRVDDMGTLLLAGESIERSIDLDVYPDIHLRGLQVVGVPPAQLTGPSRAISEVALAYLDAERPTAVRAGERLPRAAWYRLS